MASITKETSYLLFHNCKSTMDGTTSIATPGMGTWLIILLLFLFLLGGNNGFAFGNNNNAAAFMAGAASQDRGPSSAELLIGNNTMWQNQLASQQALANQTTLITQGFCGVNSNIEKAILQGQQNTAAIIANDTANTQKILDMMCANTITQLRTDLAEAKLEANNAQQTIDLVNRLAPYPTPSWIVSSPYTSIYPPATTAASNW